MSVYYLSKKHRLQQRAALDNEDCILNLMKFNEIYVKYNEIYEADDYLNCTSMWTLLFYLSNHEANAISSSV